MWLCLFRFINMKLKSVTFIDSTFRNCYFDDVTSVGSFFRNCTFIDAFFFNTGEILWPKILKLLLWHEHTAGVISDSSGIIASRWKRFFSNSRETRQLYTALWLAVLLLPNCDLFCILWADIDESKLIDGTEVVNSTFTHNKTGCQMTFDDDYSAYWVYFINFLGTLAVLPGNIVSALLMDKIGRLSMLGKNVGQEWGSCLCVHLSKWFSHWLQDVEMIHAMDVASITEYARQFWLGPLIQLNISQMNVIRTNSCPVCVCMSIRWLYGPFRHQLFLLVVWH